jgi:quinol monooxygenase YgiN
MKSLSRALLACAALALCSMQTARSQDSNPAYIVAYFETLPAVAAKARDLVQQLAEQSRKDAGNLRFEALQRIGQPNHFAILEVWKNKEAQAAHASAAHTTQFREKLASLLRSPYDERPHTGLSLGAPQATARGKPGVYVVTHVDIVPAEKDKGIGFVQELAQASRGDAGNLRFDVLQQSSRPNHLTVVEAWSSQDAVDAHGSVDHTKQFREKLTPLSGSLYDERLYRLLN